MGIFYREKAFHAGKKNRKNEIAPSEKYACYAPGGRLFHRGKYESYMHSDPCSDRDKYDTRKYS